MSRLARNIAYNFAGQGLVALLGVIAVKFVFGSLGGDAVGLIYFTLSLNVVLCSVLDLGISATILREVSLHAAKDPPYILNLVRTASSIYWGGYLVLALSAAALAPLLIPNWIHLTTLNADEAVEALRWMGVAVVTALPRALYIAIIRGLERMEVNNTLDVLASVLLQGGLIWIVRRGGHLPQVAVWFLICLGLWTASYALACARLLSWRAIVPGVSEAVVRRNAHFAGGMLSITILGMVHNQADKLLVSKLLPIGVFGVYGFAAASIARVTALTSAIVQAAFPSLASGFEEGSRQGMEAQFGKLQDFVCIVIAPILAGIFFAVRPVVLYAFDAPAARLILAPAGFLCLGYYVNAAWNIPYVVAVAKGLPGIASRAYALALVVVLPATFWLVKRFGPAGAGFSWILYNLFACAYIVPRVTAACFGTTSGRWFRQVGRFVVLSCGVYLPAWLLADRIGASSIPALALAYAAATVVFLCFAGWMSGPELRAVAARGLRRSLPGLWAAIRAS